MLKYIAHYTKKLLFKRIDGTVIRVADGDTLELSSGLSKKNYRIRFYAIDAPELAQEYGKESREFLEKLVGRNRIKIKIKDKDQYGRLVSLVYCNGKNINEELVRNGWACYYEKHAPDYHKLKKLEEEAKKCKRGMWKAGNNINPSEYRKNHRR